MGGGAIFWWRSHRRALSVAAHFLAPLSGNGRLCETQGLPVTSKRRRITNAHAPRRAFEFPTNQQLQNETPLPLVERCEAVVEGVVNGAIDAIATDHAPHAGSEKMQEFREVPFGINRPRNGTGIALDRLLHSGKININRPDRIVYHQSGSHFGPRSRELSRPARPPTSPYSRPNSSGLTTSTNRFPKPQHSLQRR